jgi:ATP-binding cassette subfamily B protein
MFNLRLTAEQLGLEARVLKVSVDAFKNDITLPCIAYVDGQHFVVLTDCDHEKISIIDPAIGELHLDVSDFTKRFFYGENKTGYILELKPTTKNYANKKHQTKSSILSLFSYLKPYKKEIFIVLTSLAIGCVAQMIFPILTQKIVDVAITRKSLSTLTVILLGSLMLVFSTTIATYIQGWVVMFVGSRINVLLVYEILGKLVRLPMHFFDSRRSGDILTRVSDQYKIEDLLTRSSIEITINVLTFLVFAGMAFFYSFPAFCILIAGDIVYAIWTIRFLPKRRSLDYETFKNMSDSQDCIIETINGMPEIKLNNYYPKKSQAWLSIQKKSYQTTIASTKLNQQNDSGATLISELISTVILFFAASQVISGGISLGSMLALQYITGQMIAPIQNSVGLIHSMQDAAIAFERQQDIIRQDEEIDSSKSYQNIDNLQGDIILSNINFTYEGALLPSITNINLSIPYNKVTAIVGASGSGKTTLIKMLLGFYKPQSGTILINGVNMTDINMDEWRKKCGAVLQEGYIFSDTIIENIIQSCPYDKQRFEEVAALTNITKFAMTQPLGFNTKIGENGAGLSLGQRQRILIARALYKNPEFLLFDEATNSLDALNEQEIWSRLIDSFPGKTVLISAHRLSTIRQADQIVVMKEGKVVECGSHEKLMDKHGEYYKLVKAQLA